MCVPPNAAFTQEFLELHLVFVFVWQVVFQLSIFFNFNVLFLTALLNLVGLFFFPMEPSGISACKIRHL